MPTPTVILSLAPGAGYLAANSQNKTVLFNTVSRQNPLLPQQIFGLYYVIKKIFDNDPTYSGIVPACNYLWEIMGRYGLAAQAITGGGGSVTPITPITGYVFRALNDTITADSSTYQNNDLIDARDLGLIIVNDQSFSASKGDFTFNPVGGIVTFVNISLFIDDDITLLFNQKV